MCLLSSGHVVGGSSSSVGVSGGVGIGDVDEDECLEIWLCISGLLERFSCSVSSLRRPRNTTPSAMSSRQSAHLPLSFVVMPAQIR